MNELRKKIGLSQRHSPLGSSDRFGQQHPNPYTIYYIAIHFEKYSLLFSKYSSHKTEFDMLDMIHLVLDWRN